MASPLAGTGLWIWYLPGALSVQAARLLPVHHLPARVGHRAPEPAAVQALSFEWLASLQALGLSHVLVKAGDGTTRWGQYSRALVDACHAAGLRCLPWVYAYGDNPIGEAAMAADVMAQGGDGLVVDVEYEYVGQFAAAELYVDGLRAALPDTYLAYAPDFRIAFANRWPNGGWQPENEPWPWAAFNRLDAVLPQLYWTDFAQSWQQTMALCTLWAAGVAEAGWPCPPIFPLLPANAYPSAVVGACEWAIAQGMTGASLWRWGSQQGGVIEDAGAVAWAAPGDATLSAEERTELDLYRAQQPYYDTMLGTQDSPGGLVGQALGIMEQEAQGESDRAALAQVVLQQCAGVRAAGGF